MAVIELNHEESSTTLDEYLRYCQIISDAFTKALDQNECNVKVLVGIAQEITNQKEEVEDLWEIMKPEVYIPPATGEQVVVKDLDNNLSVVEQPTNTNQNNSINTVKRKMKDSCYHCDIGWPGLDFNENFNWSFQKLKASLDTYISSFKQITNPNMCHVSSAFNYSCLQDLLKLIALLLSAYSAILALRKLSGISLSAFIKGVISGLLGQLLGSISLQLDLSKTGLSCIIKVFEEIANNIPDSENLATYISDTDLQLIANSLDSGKLPKQKASETNTIKVPIYESYTDSDGIVKQRVVRYEERQVPDTVKTTPLPDDSLVQPQTIEEKEAQIPYVNLGTDKSLEQSKFQQALGNYQNDKGQNFLKQYITNLKKDTQNYNNILSGSFKYVNDTISQATDDFNATISQLFGLLDYFQCEFARTGTDFLELLEYMQRLINVINLLSAVVSVIAKKQVEKLCKTKESIKDFSDIIRKDIDLGGSHDLDPVDVIEEFIGKVVDETKDENDEIIPIIYDKPKEPLLPKLSLRTCNLKEFIDAHNIDNIIDKAIEEVRKDLQDDRNTIKYPDYNPRTTDFPHVSLPDQNVIDKDNWRVYPIQFVRPDFTKPEWFEKEREGQVKDILTNDNQDYGLKSILDFVYNNPLDRNTTTKNTDAVSNETVDTQQPSDDNSFRERIKTPTHLDNGNKSTFKNECRNIEDVLTLLGTIQRK